MKALFFTMLLAVLLPGCRSADPFDRLVEKLTDRERGSTIAWFTSFLGETSQAMVAPFSRPSPAQDRRDECQPPVTQLSRWARRESQRTAKLGDSSSPR